MVLVLWTLSPGVPSSDPVTPTSIHSGASGLNKIVNESTGKQCLELGVLSSAQSTACQCLSLLSTAPVLWPQWCGPMRAVLEHCSATGIKFTNAPSNHVIFSRVSHKFCLLLFLNFPYMIACLLEILVLEL